MKSICLNHDGENAVEMFDLTKDDGHRIKNLITFETLKGYLLSDELYTDDSAPRILTTKSGCIERCLDRLYTDSEKAFFFMIFINTHDGIGKAYSIYKHLDEHIERMTQGDDYTNLDDGIDGQLKRLIVKKISQDIKQKFSLIGEVLECIKNNNYNYELFMDEFSDKHGDLTDAIAENLTELKRRMNNDED